METISDKFIKGLKRFNLTQEELIDWKYCSGNKGRHLNYFNLSCPDDDVPELTGKCVCGHTIKENCYITNGEEILVLGNCCIKRFIPKCSRTCETCGDPHKNRIVNRCNKCRAGVCDKCGISCSESYNTCYRCV